MYSGATNDVVDPLLYQGFVEELVEVLEMKQGSLHVSDILDTMYLHGDMMQEVKAGCLRTLTAMIHLERDPKLSAIIEATGASTYHGFLPSLVRECIASLTGTTTMCAVGLLCSRIFFVDTNAGMYPQAFATALFSFLYHLATYEAS